MQSELPLTLILSPLRAGRGQMNARIWDLCSVTRTRCHQRLPSPFLQGRGSGWGSVSTSWKRL